MAAVGSPRIQSLVECGADGRRDEKLQCGASTGEACTARRRRAAEPVHEDETRRRDAMRRDVWRGEAEWAVARLGGVERGTARSEANRFTIPSHKSGECECEKRNEPARRRNSEIMMSNCRLVE